MRPAHASSSSGSTKKGPSQGHSTECPSSSRRKTSLPTEPEISRIQTTATPTGLRTTVPAPRSPPLDPRQRPSGVPSSQTDEYESDIIALAQLILAGALSEGMSRWMALYLRVQEAAIEGKPPSAFDAAALEYAARGKIAIPAIPDNPTSPLGRALRRKRSEPEAGSAADRATTSPPTPTEAQPSQPKKLCTQKPAQPQLTPRAIISKPAARVVTPSPAPASPRRAVREQPSYASKATAPPAGSSRQPPQPVELRNPNPAIPSSKTTDADQSETPSTSDQMKTTRYPPIVVERLPDWVKHFARLSALLGRPPNARPYGQGIRFIPTDADEYRGIQDYLDKLEGVHWFTYTLPAKRSLKVAIRGLPVDTNPTEITEALSVKRHIVEYVRPINGRGGRPGCIYHAVLQRTPGLIPAIYNTTELLNMTGISIEAWRGKRRPAQCHRCQQFRHTSQNCHRPTACVRCGGSHPARLCERPRSEPATCANCGGAHPANSLTACPVFKREIRNRRAGTVARSGDARRTADPNPAPQMVEESAAGSLMAPANDPPPRRDPAKQPRSKKPARMSEEEEADLAKTKEEVIDAIKKAAARKGVQPGSNEEKAGIAFLMKLCL